ncbi:MAG TPA: hypothetical protein DEQ77_02015, partial [Candidatus Omnitrophica bacterium]|nr:hypothetical protein [Candidatus Omnitrophota bacterium]
MSGQKAGVIFPAFIVVYITLSAPEVNNALTNTFRSMTTMFFIVFFLYFFANTVNISAGYPGFLYAAAHFGCQLVKPVRRCFFHQPMDKADLIFYRQLFRQAFYLGRADFKSDIISHYSHLLMRQNIAYYSLPGQYKFSLLRQSASPLGDGERRPLARIWTVIYFIMELFLTTLWVGEFSKSEGAAPDAGNGINYQEANNIPRNRDIPEGLMDKFRKEEVRMFMGLPYFLEERNAAIDDTAAKALEKLISAPDFKELNDVLTDEEIISLIRALFSVYGYPQDKARENGVAQREEWYEKFVSETSRFTALIYWQRAVYNIEKTKEAVDPKECVILLNRAKDNLGTARYFYQSSVKVKEATPLIACIDYQLAEISWLIFEDRDWDIFPSFHSVGVLVFIPEFISQRFNIPKQDIPVVVQSILARIKGREKEGVKKVLRKEEISTLLRYLGELYDKEDLSWKDKFHHEYRPFLAELCKQRGEESLGQGKYKEALEYFERAPSGEIAVLLKPTIEELDSFVNVFPIRLYNGITVEVSNAFLKYFKNDDYLYYRESFRAYLESVLFADQQIKCLPGAAGMIPAILRKLKDKLTDEEWKFILEAVIVYYWEDVQKQLLDKNENGLLELSFAPFEANVWLDKILYHMEMLSEDFLRLWIGYRASQLPLYQQKHPEFNVLYDIEQGSQNYSDKELRVIFASLETKVRQEKDLFAVKILTRALTKSKDNLPVLLPTIHILAGVNPEEFKHLQYAPLVMARMRKQFRLSMDEAISEFKQRLFSPKKDTKSEREAALMLIALYRDADYKKEDPAFQDFLNTYEKVLKSAGLFDELTAELLKKFKVEIKASDKEPTGSSPLGQGRKIEVPPSSRIILWMHPLYQERIFRDELRKYSADNIMRNKIEQLIYRYSKFQEETAKNVEIFDGMKLVIADNHTKKAVNNFLKEKRVSCNLLTTKYDTFELSGLMGGDYICGWQKLIDVLKTLDYKSIILVGEYYDGLGGCVDAAKAILDKHFMVSVKKDLTSPFGFCQFEKTIASSLEPDKLSSFPVVYQEKAMAVSVPSGYPPRRQAGSPLKKNKPVPFSLSVHFQGFDDRKIISSLPVGMIEVKPDKFNRSEQLILWDDKRKCFIEDEANMKKLVDFTRLKNLKAQWHFPEVIAMAGGRTKEWSIGDTDEFGRLLAYFEFLEKMRRKYNLAEELIVTVHPPKEILTYKFSSLVKEYSLPAAIIHHNQIPPKIKRQIERDILKKANQFLILLGNTIQEKGWRIKVGVENMRPSTQELWRIGNKISDFKLLLKDTPECIGLTLDTGHMFLTGEDLNLEKFLRFAHRHKKRIFNIHFHENRGKADDHMFPTPKGLKELYGKTITLTLFQGIPLDVEVTRRAYKQKKLVLLFNALFKELERRQNKITRSASPIEIIFDGLPKDVKGNRRHNIGVFVSMFNPPTIAMSQLIEQAKEQYHLEGVLLVLVKSPSDTMVAGVSLEQRLRMARLAFEDKGPYALALSKDYLYRDIADEILRKFPKADLYFIMGIGSFEKMFTWHYKGKDIKDFLENRQCNFIVSETEGKTVKEFLRAHPRNRSLAASVKTIRLKEAYDSITSAKARNFIKWGEPVEPLVHRLIAHYIQEKGLYKFAGGRIGLGEKETFQDYLKKMEESYKAKDRKALVLDAIEAYIRARLVQGAGEISVLSIGSAQAVELKILKERLTPAAIHYYALDCNLDIIDQAEQNEPDFHYLAMDVIDGDLSRFKGKFDVVITDNVWHEVFS